MITRTRIVLLVILSSILILIAGTLAYPVFGFFGFREKAPADADVILQDAMFKPADESYTDEETNLVFPARSANYQKVLVRKNFNPVFGTTVHYENPNGSFADIYLYRLDTGAKAVSPAEFEQNYQETHKRILNMKNDLEGDLDVSVQEIPENIYPGAVSNDSSSVHAVSFQIKIEEEEVLSHLIMFEKNGTIVKIRMTDPLPLSETAALDNQIFLADLLKQINPEDSVQRTDKKS